MAFKLGNEKRKTRTPDNTNPIYRKNLDDGVLVNYNKFGNAIAPVSGLNDKKAKEKVRKFDWIDTTTIR